jgi:hypothetical protein
LDEIISQIAILSIPICAPLYCQRGKGQDKETVVGFSFARPLKALLGKSAERFGWDVWSIYQ